MCKTVLEKYNEFGDSKVKEDKDVLDDFVKTEYLSDFLQELPYDVAIKHQQALQKYGNLFVRNSFGVISVRDLLNIYTESPNTAVLDYIFPERFGKPCGLKILDKKTGETFCKSFRYFKDPELTTYLSRFTPFHRFHVLLFVRQAVEDYEKLHRILLKS